MKKLMFTLAALTMCVMANAATLGTTSIELVSAEGVSVKVVKLTTDSDAKDITLKIEAIRPHDGIDENAKPHAPYCRAGQICPKTSGVVKRPSAEAVVRVENLTSSQRELLSSGKLVELMNSFELSYTIHLVPNIVARVKGGGPMFYKRLDIVVQ